MLVSFILPIQFFGFIIVVVMVLYCWAAVIHTLPYDLLFLYCPFSNLCWHATWEDAAFCLPSGMSPVPLYFILQFSVNKTSFQGIINTSIPSDKHKYWLLLNSLQATCIEYLVCNYCRRLQIAGLWALEVVCPGVQIQD